MEKITLGIIILLVLVSIYIVYLLYQEYFATPPPPKPTKNSSILDMKGMIDDLLPPKETPSVLSNFTKLDGFDIMGNDIQCYGDNEPVENCAKKCLADPTCKACNKTLWQGKNGCCYKTASGPLVPTPNVTFYMKI